MINRETPPILVNLILALLPELLKTLIFQVSCPPKIPLAAVFLDKACGHYDVPGAFGFLDLLVHFITSASKNSD